MWFYVGIFLNNLLIICNTYFSTQLSNLLSFTMCVSASSAQAISTLPFRFALLPTHPFSNPIRSQCSVFNVKFKFLILLLAKRMCYGYCLLQMRNLRHILRFSVCKFKFYVLAELTRGIFKSETFQVLSRFAGGNGSV
jgi:hypothetical protein